MKKIFNEAIKKSILYLLVISALYFALVATSAIPNEKIAENMGKSALYFKDAEAFSFENGERLNAVSDNYADSIILNLSYNMGKGNPFRASLSTAYYEGKDGLNRGLYQTVTENALPDTPYTRYWHGTAIFIRLMHLFTDISVMKTVGLTAILQLLMANLFILLRKKNYITSVALLLGALIVNIWNLRLSLEYQSSFIIGFGMCLAFLLSEKNHEKWLSYIALSGGCLMAFFDFLTTETVGILLPLILITSVRIEERRFDDTKEYIKIPVNCILSYAFGYGFAFISKWILASVATGENKFTEAFSKSGALLERSGETADNIFLRMINAVMANFTVLCGGRSRIEYIRFFAYSFVFALLIFSLLYLFKKEKKAEGIYVLLALGTLVILRYMALPAHSYMHNFFTYRALISTLTAIFAAIGLKVKWGEAK